MTLEDLRRLPLLQTRAIAASCEDTETFAYVLECVNRFYRGDYGKVAQEDSDANNRDLRAGEGHILARYEGRYMLDRDIYIESHFSESVPGIDANNTLIMYCNER